MTKDKKLLKQEIEDLIEEFSYLETPMEKMQFIIELGKEGESDSNVALDEFKIEGCVSNAYLKLNDNLGDISISYYADALIIQGFLAIICDLLTNTSSSEIKENLELVKSFSNEVGLESFLSPNRSNALFNIFQKIESENF